MILMHAGLYVRSMLLGPLESFLLWISGCSFLKGNLTTKLVTPKIHPAPNYDDVQLRLLEGQGALPHLTSTQIPQFTAVKGTGPVIIERMVHGGIICKSCLSSSLHCKSSSVKTVRQVNNKGKSPLGLMIEQRSLFWKNGWTMYQGRHWRRQWFVDLKNSTPLYSLLPPRESLFIYWICRNNRMCSMPHTERVIQNKLRIKYLVYVQLIEPNDPLRKGSILHARLFYFCINYDRFSTIPYIHLRYTDKN